MRREHRDELFRSCLRINALLRGELSDVRQAMKARHAEAKYNPNWRLQPRAPRGTAEGGQWVSGGARPSGGPKQASPLNQPSEPPDPRFQQSQRLSIAEFERLDSANDNARFVRISIGSAGPLASLLLPLPLYGDTPRPRVEARQITADLILVLTGTGDRRGATFHRIVSPERQVPLSVFGVDTNFTTTRPAELEHLFVYATVEGDQVRFSLSNLENAYGREIPGISDSSGTPGRRLPSIVPLTTEERRLDFNLRHFGATDEEVAVALQAFRNLESDGELVISRLRRAGADRRRIQSILRDLRLARRDRPYRPPTSGALLEIFPDLASARGDMMVYPAAGALEIAPLRALRSERAARNRANALVEEIRRIDPSYVAPNLGDPTLFPVAVEGRATYIERLQQERAAALFRMRGDLQPLQVETFRFIQRRADIAYDDAARLYESGDITSQFDDREHAIGNEIDRTLDRELRVWYESLGISVEGELVRVHRGESITSSRYRIPDARVGDVFFDLSVSEKLPSEDQIIDYFGTRVRPRYVLIVRPRQRGRSYIITPSRSRYKKG